MNRRTALGVIVLGGPASLAMVSEAIARLGEAGESIEILGGQPSGGEVVGAAGRFEDVPVLTMHSKYDAAELAAFKREWERALLGHRGWRYPVLTSTASRVEFIPEQHTRSWLGRMRRRMSGRASARRT